MSDHCKFNLHFRQLDGIPRLAWCVRIIRGQQVVSVLHGAAVERAPDGSSFHEGAWSGRYGDHRFDDATTFTGSGARLTPGGILFATATHTLEPIHVMHGTDDVLCSNSLHFLLSEAGDGIRADYPYYAADIMSIMFGLQRYTPAIPTANGNTVRQYYHCNFEMLLDGGLEKLDKRVVPPFQSFDEYASFLRSETSRVTANAAAPERSVRYEPLATVSSGYDSPACATIGKHAGCRNAITFTKARANFSDRDDSGTPVARSLGLEVTELDLFQRRQQRLDYPEAEFIASGHGGDDLPMAVVEPYLDGKLLFTGYHGDKVWDKNLHKAPTPYIVRGDCSGSSLAEFRLRVGFINFPIPFIGCTQHPAIHAISKSDEMDPWSLGNAYDRPIPRRIAEEAGVARHLFGQYKKAVTRGLLSNVSGNDPRIEEVLCEHSYRDFLAFTEGTGERVGYKLHYDAMHLLYRLNERVAWSGRLRRLLGAIGLTAPSVVSVPWKYAKRRSINPFAFHWAADKMRARYTRRVE